MLALDNQITTMTHYILLHLITFLKEPLCSVILKSILNKIKAIVENHEDYEKVFNKILQELKIKEIKHRIAVTKDNSLTGYNVLSRESKNKQIDNTSKMKVLANLNND